MHLSKFCKLVIVNWGLSMKDSEGLSEIVFYCDGDGLMVYGIAG